MKRDQELYKIQCIILALRKFENKMYSTALGSEGDERVRKYIAMRYKYLFDWIQGIK